MTLFLPFFFYLCLFQNCWWSRDWEEMLQWLVSSSALPFLFFVCGKKMEECQSKGMCGCCRCNLSLFHGNQCCSEVKLDLAGTLNSSPRLRGVQMYSDEHVVGSCELQVIRYKQNIPVQCVLNNWVVCREKKLWPGDPKTRVQTSSVYYQT